VKKRAKKQNGRLLEGRTWDAVATVNGMDLIITWNFAHLSNPFTRVMVRQIVENEGYQCPEICSPEKLLEVDT